MLARDATAVALGGLAAIAVTLGVVFDVNAGQDTNRINSIRATQTAPCANLTSPTCLELQHLLDTQHSDSGLALGFYIGAGVLAAATVTTLLVWPRSSNGPKQSVWLAPVVSERPGGLRLGGVF